jgi:TetR/AcrR family transcriptional regulator, cholesterol catabolism regulator
MRDPNLPLVEEVRKILSGYTSDEFTFQNLAKDINKPKEILVEAFGTESVLVEEILNFEQQNLENIFSEADFTDINAIDGLLHVSKEISNKLVNILPCITFDLRLKFPEVRQSFVEKRINFVDSKIKGNFEDGMAQGMYRPDLSPELISRIYISRLIDMHNPDLFPNQTISFSVLFDVMFDTFIRGICTVEGKDHYEKKIKCMKFKYN